VRNIKKNYWRNGYWNGSLKIKKMNQSKAILYLLSSGPKTTNELIQAPFHLAAEYRRAISDLRRKGYVIKYTSGKRGTGIYTLLPAVKAEANGQLIFV